MGKRKTSEATKKQVAASQRWTCGLCLELLSSSFEVDHTVPLWNNGTDVRENLRALCSNCHSQKTQKEAVERTEAKRLRREDIRRSYELAVQREEEGRRRELGRPTGTVKCLDCEERFYPIFAHECKKVAERVRARLGRKSHVAKPDLGMLFQHFYFTAI